MQRVIFTLLVLLLSFTLKGQDPVIDSLKSVLKNNIADSVRVNTLIELAGNYYRSDPQEALKIATQAKELADKIEYKNGLALAHKALGMAYYFQNDWVDALVEWEFALDVFRSVNDLNGESNMLNNLGAVHFNGGDSESALDFYLQSLRVAEANGDSLRIVTALINIGSVYLLKESGHSLAFQYYKRALPLSNKLEDYDAIGTCAVNLGELYLADTLKLDSALFYFETALDAYQKSATGNVAIALNSIGKVYSVRREYEQAIAYQLEAYNLAKALDARLEMAQTLLSLANTYERQGNIPKAIESFRTAEALAQEIGAYNLVLLAYGGLADSYAEKSDYSNAYQYKTLFSNIKDTIYNAEMDKQLQAQTLSYEIEKKQGQISLLEKDQELKAVELQRQKTIRNATLLVGLLLLVVLGGLFSRYNYTRKTNKIIAAEKDRSDKLLLNILPQETADELKSKGSATPKYYEKVSVLFTDFKGFTTVAEKLSPQQLVEELNHCFMAFDNIIDKYKLEKIKTIGDAYMCAGGIPAINDNNPIDVVLAALEIRDFMDHLKVEREAEGKEIWELRIGIHTGPVIAGVVGKNKFAYDIWGDAVNTASRMESSGIPGQVNISGTTYQFVADYFQCVHRGKVEAKNKGEIDMYLVEGPKAQVVVEEVLIA